jgi:hypothetical protein
MKTRQRWLLLIFILVAIFVLFFLLIFGGFGSGRSSSQLQLHINLDELTEREKCPACFGVNLCPQMITGKIQLTDWTKFSLSRLMNKKNVFYADWTIGSKETKVRFLFVIKNKNIGTLKSFLFSFRSF